MYAEDERLLLSGIQHYAYCKRQWALIHIEQQWQENLRTIEGMFLHERTHENFSESRGGIITSRGVAVFSNELGIQGVCDVVEFHPDESGVALFGRTGKYRPVPVEYKRGKPKEHDADELQLCAQAMCLMEMLACEIPEGYLFYGETRRRVQVPFEDALQERVRAMVKEMHTLFERGHTPKARQNKGCKACSLADLCVPGLEKAKSASRYVQDKLGEEVDV